MKSPLVVILGVVVLSVLFNALFILDQRQQALILQLGQVVDTRQKPGLHFKVPFIQSVVLYDHRVLNIDMEPQEVIAFDRKRLIVDAFAKYRIVDPLEYYKSVRTEAGLNVKFKPVLESSIREEIGRVNLIDLLSGKRTEPAVVSEADGASDNQSIATDDVDSDDIRTKVMDAIQDRANEVAGNYGIVIEDVRIMRTDLPQENSNAIYERMKTQHEKEARQTRAEGAEESLKITSNAEKEKKVIIAEAKKTSEILRGEGDGKATKIFADAFSRDSDFYKFYRTMQAYRESMKDSDTRMILSPDSEFMNFFGNIRGNSSQGSR